MRNEHPLLFVLGILAAFFGLIASLVTIVNALAPDLQISELFSGDGFRALHGWVMGYLEQWPLGPLPTALIISALVSLLAFLTAMELIEWMDLEELAAYMGLQLLATPLYLAWILLFADSHSPAALSGYAFFALAGPLIVPVALAVAFWLADRSELIKEIRGVISSVSSENTDFATTYVIVLEIEGDIPKKVELARSAISGENLLTNGTSVLARGKWDSEGTFQASSISRV